MAAKGDTTDKSMAQYFTKLWTTGDSTYRMVAKEMNKTPYRMSNGKAWGGQNVSYYAQKILGLKGIREYAKSSTTTKTKTTKTTDDDLFSPATDKLVIQILESGLATSKKINILQTIFGG